MKLFKCTTSVTPTDSILTIIGAAWLVFVVPETCLGGEDDGQEREREVNRGSETAQLQWFGFVYSTFESNWS